MTYPEDQNLNHSSIFTPEKTLQKHHLSRVSWDSDREYLPGNMSYANPLRLNSFDYFFQSNILPVVLLIFKLQNTLLCIFSQKLLKHVWILHLCSYFFFILISFSLASTVLSEVSELHEDIKLFLMFSVMIVLTQHSSHFIRASCLCFCVFYQISNYPQ